MSFNIPQPQGKRIVIIGGGFGGLELARQLRHSPYQVVLIDKNNYHQFPPLLYQIASAGLEPSSISFPFRKLFQRRSNVFFRMAELRSIHPEEHWIQTSIGKLTYDYLILASGATTNYFGNDNIASNAMPMKTLSEAMGLRNALLANFERAITCASDDERRQLLNVVVVGGGPSGVEVAGALSEMKRYVLPKDYPDMPSDLMNITLIEAGPRLLSAMDERTSDRVLAYLKRMGVNVMLNKRVTDYVNHRVMLSDGTDIATRTFIWVSGVQGVSVGNMDKQFIGRGGRIIVDAHNAVKGLQDVYSIGDQCIMSDTDPNYPAGHPQVAQVAIQQGRQLGKNFLAMLQGKPLNPFRYNNLGALATIGRNKAVAEIGRMHFSGFPAWLLWLLVHLRSILSVRNKLIVLVDWIWNYIYYSQSIRIIVYAKKAREVVEREKLLATTHWATPIDQSKPDAD